MSILKTNLLALLAILPAVSLASYNTSYTVDRPLNDDFEITNLFLLERGPFGGSATWAFRVDQDQPQVTITNPFPTDNLPAESLLIGLTHDLPGDAPGQKHVVLMMDDVAAALSNHIGWGTLFTHTLEDQLISDIELASSGQDWPIIQPGLDGIGTFTNGDAETGILAPGGIPRSAWFTFGGTFTVVAWSDGAIIGTGSSVGVPAAVPEPASIAVMGLGLVGLARRRAKSRSALG